MPGGDGFVLADGSTSIALENETYAASHNAKKYAEVCGYAMTHEGVAYGDVAGTEKGLMNAIVDAAAMAGITLDQKTNWKYIIHFIFLFAIASIIIFL